jgi:hypothetical protein
VNPWLKPCEACGETMLKAYHERTRSPAYFDPYLIAGGNIEIIRRQGDGRMFLMYRIVPKAEIAADPTRLRHQSHFVTCTQPGRFRGRR